MVCPSFRAGISSVSNILANINFTLYVQALFFRHELVVFVEGFPQRSKCALNQLCFYLLSGSAKLLKFVSLDVHVWRSEISNYACINKMVISADCGWGSIEVDGWPGEIREQVGT